MSKLLDGTELGSVVRRQTRAAPLPCVVLSDADKLTMSHYLALKKLSISIFLQHFSSLRKSSCDDTIVPLVPRAVCGWCTK